MDQRKSGPRGITCLQTDDTANAGNMAFAELESKALVRFQGKPVETLIRKGPIRFNGASIELQKDGSICVHQDDQVSRIRKVEQGDKDEYVAQRARGAYIASTCAPTLSYAFSAAAQIQEPDEKAFEFLNRHLERCKQENGLVFKALKKPLHMAVFVDAAFANNRDLSSQLGFIVTLMDSEGAANIIHYSSQKSKRMNRSALAAELYAMMNGFDTAAALKVSLDQLEVNNGAAAKRYPVSANNPPKGAVPMVIYTDSRSLYDSLVSLNTTTEKRLLIDLHLLRQAYERREIAEP